MFLARYEDSSLALLTCGQLKVGCQDSLSADGTLEGMTTGLLHFTSALLSSGLHASYILSQSTSASAVIQIKHKMHLQQDI